MVQIIHLHGDPHKETQTLLPWYANGSLEPAEAAAVEAHLAECAECRADLKLEHVLSASIADLPADTAQGWETLRARVESEAAQRPVVRKLPANTFLRRPVPMGWVIAAQAACLVVVVGAGGLALKPSVRPQYQALGAAPAAQAGNLVVVFRPTTSEQDLRGLLIRSGARLVDGPTASDAYVLHVAPAERNEILTRFRSNSHIVLAEPIDGAARP
jgi:anti-sigma factor RsiW